MVQGARACGASANYTGSGAAIIAVGDDSHRESLIGALGELGCGTAAPALAT